jgi:GDP-4-dehydro-6-deoxy-D-mannose reductase
MRILVTGGNGFAGRHLLHNLTTSGHETILFDLRFDPGLDKAADQLIGDIRDRETVSNMIRDLKPDGCVHLGAMAFVPDGNPAQSPMLDINLMGSLHLLDAIRDHAPTCRTLVVSTAHVYTFGSTGTHVDETSPLGPVGLYAISKAAADMAAQGYAHRYDLPIMTARPDNHTGPGQSPRFVTASFAKQIKEIATGKQNALITVGNLESRRAFLDVRDTVEAYRLLLENGTPGNAYNISGDKLVKIGDLLNQLCELAGVKPEIQVDPQLYRPTDSAPILNSDKLKSKTGWTPTVPLIKTLEDMLKDTSL